MRRPGQVHFVDEEYALWGSHRISRQAYDDGGAIIDGVPRRIDSAVIRRRLLTPYNFIFVGNRHVINDNAHDRPLGTLLDGILLGTHSLKDVVTFVANLPQPNRLLSDWD